jgi:hypothetical protein
MKNISYDGTSYFLNKLLLSSLLYSKFLLHLFIILTYIPKLLLLLYKLQSD